MKAWEGRFSGRTHPFMEKFGASIGFDRLLFEEDIEGSIAQARMLGKIGVLTATETRQIVKALREIRTEIATGRLPFSEEKEDIHMHIEARLIEKTGEAGKKLHTGRSRNDQVALDMRLFVRKSLAEIDDCLVELMRCLLDRAAEEARTIMPGYTHLQRAQVVTLGQHLMAYFFMFKRDRGRLRQALSSADSMPLGSGALAGSTIPLDREFVRVALKFSRLSENSMDAVSDRDFVIDTVFCCTMIMTHLSRLAEDLILFSTAEFGFIALPDELSTGSSLMPQKKNPDPLELTRGKAARVMGDLVSLLALMKGLPLTYNRDLQEDKEPLFHAVATAKDALTITSLVVGKMAVNRARLAGAAREGFLTATELAEYLVVKGVPFREAHGMAGRIVRECEEQDKPLTAVTLKALKKHSALFEKDVLEYIRPERILNSRKTAGGASFHEVEKTIEKERHTLPH